MNKRCRHKKKLHVGEMICPHGCDYIRARELHQADVEKKLGIKLDETFFCYKGVSFKADGGEAPYVNTTIGGKEYTFNETDLRALQEGIHQALSWCKDGYAPGIC